MADRFTTYISVLAVNIVCFNIVAFKMRALTRSWHACTDTPLKRGARRLVVATVGTQRTASRQ